MQKIIIGDKLIAKNSYREYIVKEIRVKQKNVNKEEWQNMSECMVDLGVNNGFDIRFILNDGTCGYPYYFYPKSFPIKVICTLK